MTVWMIIRQHMVCVICVYGPRTGRMEAEKEAFRGEVERLAGLSDGQTMLCVAGGFNAQIGVVGAGDESSIGRFGWGTRNREERELVEMLRRNGLAVAGTCFQKKKSHNITCRSGIMDQRSRCIPREYPGSPVETKDPNRSPNSETDPDTDLNHQGANHVFLDIGPAIRILQLNIEGTSAAKREILSTICSKHNIDIICLQEVHAKADISRSRLVIDNYDLVAFIGHQQHGRATYVRSDIAKAELLELATLFDTIRVGSYKITNVYKPPPTDWTNAALPAHQHPVIYVGDFNSHHATWGYERAGSNGDWLMEWSSQLNLSLVIDLK